MRLHTFIAAIALTLFSALGLSAQSVRVIFVSGQASLQSPGETNLRPVTKGEVVTLGTRIVTGADGRVALTPMPGVKSLIAPNTDLLIESATETRAADGKVTTAATLDLKQGAVVTDLIKQEGVTYDYNIRTPRGLAGARGTNYTVLVNSGGLETILVSHGTIVFNLLDGRSLSVTAGQIQITDATGNVRSASSMDTLAASDQAVAQEIAEATLNALEAALDAGVTINPEAISQAINLFESFGLDLSASTLDTLNRLRSKLDELTAKTTKEESTIVTETSTPPATLDSFLASLDPTQAAAFSEIISLGGFNNTDPVFLAKFADPTFTKALLETVNLYASLSPGQKNYAGLTGILGNANLTAVGANSEGLFRLLTAYSNRNNVSPTQVDEFNLADPLATFSLPFEEVFFPGTTGNSGSTIFNGYFGNVANPTSLYVGATRYFRLTNNLNLSGAKTFNVATGGDVEIRAADEISLTSTPSLRISFSSDLRGILMEAVTLNLLNVSFPEGSVVSLTSRDGGFTSTVNSRIKVPNFGSSQTGRVNFLGGVYYGSNLLDSDSAFVTGSRGNIAIHSFAEGTNLGYPAYTYPPGTYGAFVASLTTAQAAAFADILSLGGFNNTDPAFLAKFSDSNFTSALVNTIDLYISLPATERATAATLGILGSANFSAIGTNSTGLARLLASYTTLLGNTALPTPSYQSESAYPAGTTNSSGSNNVFFNGSSGLGGQMLYNGVFGDTTNPGDLYIGATRYFFIANDAAFSSTSVNFNVSTGVATQNGGTTTPPVAAGNTGGNVEIRAGEGIKLAGLAAVPITFSADTRNVLLESITINLANVNFPEGSLVNLTSRDGGVTSSYDPNFKIPNFGTPTIGRVNFLGGVYYGANLLDSDSAFVTGSRGNIAIHSFADGTNLPFPSYTYPPGTYGAFVANLTTAQAAAFADILSLGGFNKTDPAFLAKFSDSNFTSALVNTIDLYISLPAADRTTATTLGILGSGNSAAIGTDSTGLASLLASYTTLLADTTIPAPSFESEADYTSGTNFGAGSNNVFFNGSSGLGGQMLYNGVFGDLTNPGDLYVGATRFFRLSNDAAFSGTSANFNVKPGIVAAVNGTAILLSSGANTGGDVQIRAGEGIELSGLIANPITFSADTRTILMESITINLANVNFPEGSTAVLVSRDGGNSYTSNGSTYTVPNFNSRTVGKVNFLGGVFYGANILDSEQAYVDGSRGNIAIYSFTDGLVHEDPVYTPVPLTAEQLYMATLTPSQFSIFITLPADVRTKLVNLNDTDITGVMLAVDPSNGLVHTPSSMSRYLDAYTALSAQARAFFKTLGGANGSGLTNLNGTPDIVRWSTTAIENAATNFNSMDSTTQGALIALGSGDTIVGLNPDYTTGLVAALGSDLPSVVEAGWGRYLHNLVNDSFLSDINDAAKNATPAQRAVVSLLDLSPYSLAEILEINAGNPASIYARLDFLNSNFTTADFELLAKLGYHDTFSLFNDTDTNTLANINAVVAHYNALTPAQQDAARALGMGSLLIDNTRAASLADFYIGLSPSQQEAMRETGLFSAFYGPNPNDAVTQPNVVSALNAYLGLNSTIQNYLLAEANQDNLLPILTSTPTTDKEGRASRSLDDIVYILSNAPSDIGTLLDMDIAPAILYSGYLDGASPSEVTASLGNAIIFYQSLTASQQGTLRGLGIMGSGHVGYLGADYAGVNRLLSAYDALPLALRIDTQRIDETIGDGHKYKNHSSYFLPFNKDTGNTVTGGAMVAISFESPADLYVGAVRRLRIDNSGVDGAPETFTVPLDGNRLQAYDIHLAAGDLIDLNVTPISLAARGIVMDAITINLSNFDFPEGTVAALNSRDGGTADGSTGSGIYPHWGSPQVGRVNFLTGVTYGFQPLDFTTQFDTNARGNIAIGSHASPASLPTYTPPTTVITSPGL